MTTHSMRFREAGWWYWLATVGLLAAGLAFWPPALLGAIGLTLVQVVHFACRKRSLTAFPVQVRWAYLAMLLAGLWEPLRVLYWIQLVGTTAMVTVDYCLLARLLSLLPGNRSEPLTLSLVARRIFSAPRRGSILEATAGGGKHADVVRVKPSGVVERA